MLIFAIDDERATLEELHDAIAGSLLHMYPGLGHAAFEEAPDFNDRVFAFLKA